ncbi:hypothetical protein [Microbulbifer rhizosphaerae]|uniref:L-ribulose-5-phosphate 3-epimerase UlaE n=1 Tax=Microbulbifer rhizosphaerae TaxID=1562603 RepID=A0A7W4Z7B4_9GAMM|nr:hypothetical protein [Microbulbifer rhizosphaerae]MBB3059563.1 L-ribulose-5-phosphate 3-epimerase UlaE [Microbulbifer rhizosphaerae]
MARDIFLLDTPSLDSDAVAAGRRAESMSGVGDEDWKRLYPLIHKLQARCPLLWKIWQHQQGADADALIERAELIDLSAELQVLRAAVPPSERQQVESMILLCMEAEDRNRHIAFVAD